ncbi:MAG: DUF1573 domain-containing protein, partial [Bacteroidales bacterium]|nr:DUF1573 domain-containing protein [Bacteroidales bacterium]
MEIKIKNSIIRFSLLLLSLIAFLSVGLTQPKIQLSKLNSEYIKYLDTVKSGKISNYSKYGYPLNLVPLPVEPDFSALNNITKHKADIKFDAVYDMRTTGYLTPVKNQGACGSCWTFGTYGSIESLWKKSGFGEFDLSEDNLNNCHNFLLAPCAGGHIYMSTAYLARRSGPFTEVQDPYIDSPNDCPAGLTPFKYVTDARFLPKEPNTIKQALLDYGALYISMYWDDAAYRASDYTYYYNGAGCVSGHCGGHAITLVGWDDNKITAGSTGAWICKNSWAAYWGENGFFYISYNDASALSNVAYWPSKIDYDNNYKVFTYSELGQVSSGGYNNNTGYALIKYNIGFYNIIKKIGTWIPASNATIDYSIYDDFNGTELSGLLYSQTNLSCLFPGYYSFDLSSPVNTTSDNDIYILIKYSTPNYNYPIPIELSSSGYSNPVIETNKCWVSSDATPGSWEEIGVNLNWDLCINLYASVDDNSAPNPNFTAIKSSVFEDEPVYFTDLSAPVPSSWEWLFEGATPASSNLQNPVVVYKNSGIFDVKLTVTNAFGSNSLIKSDYIIVSDKIYCSGASNVCDEYISNVTLSNINNNSSCSQGGYSDYTSLIAELSKNIPYSISITNAVVYPGDQCGVWIDWNQDNDFDDFNETVYISNDALSNYSAIISVPSDALPGLTRMRTRITYTGNVLPCGTTQYGEVEDYSVMINQTPDIVVYQDNKIIDNNGYFIINDFVNVGDYKDVVFTIKNSGTDNLIITGTNEDSDDFSLSQLPSNTILPNESSDFTLRFQPTGSGEKVTNVTIDNNDVNNNPFKFTVKANPDLPKWTYMIYLYEDGTGLDGVDDFNELEANGSIEGVINYIVLYDANDDNKDGIYYVKKDQNGYNSTLISARVSTFLGTDPNMNDWHTLNSFMLWVNDNYPAQHYGLTLWDHGSGIFELQKTNILKACVGDMKLWELGYALNNFVTATGKKIDIVGFDVCLLGQFETVYQLKDYTDYVIASQITEPADGWDYVSAFAPLNANPDIPPAQLVINIVNSYISFYQASSISVTQAATSTESFINDIIPAFNSFSDLLISYLPAYISQIQAIRAALWSNNYNPDHKDLGNFLNKIINHPDLPADLKSSALTLLNNFDNAIIAEGHIGDENADVTGLRIWFPDNISQQPQKIYYLDPSQYLNINQTSWDDFLIAYDCNYFNISVQPANYIKCVGDDVVLFVTTNGFDLDYQWLKDNIIIDGETNSSLQISPVTLNDFGSYYCIINNNCYSITSNSATLTVNPLPEAIITAKGQTEFCEGGEVELESSEAVSYKWFKNGTQIDLSTDRTYQATETGAYTAELTDGNNCINISQAMEVTVNPLPVAIITAKGQTEFCEGGQVELESSEGVSYKWFKNGTQIDLSTDRTYQATETGAYTVELTDLNNCVNTSSAMEVTVNPLPEAIITAKGQTEFCEGGQVELEASEAVSYKWFKNGTQIDLSTDRTYQATETGAYTVELTDGNNCINISQAMEVTVNPLPVAIITAKGQTEFCEGGQLELESSEGISYKWFKNGTQIDIATDRLYQASTTGAYTVELTDGNNCINISQAMEVTVNPLPVAIITAKGQTEFCEGGQVELESSEAVSYKWFKNGTQIDIATDRLYQASTTGAYTVELTDLNNCINISQAMEVTVNPLPVAIITAKRQTEFCEGGQVELESSEAVSYKWFKNGTQIDIATDRLYQASTTGAYTVELTDLNNCVNTSSAMEVTVNPLPEAIITAKGQTEFCEGGQLELESSEAVSYKWFKNGTQIDIATDRLYQASTTGAYTVELTDLNNCVNTSSAMEVTVNPLPEAIITAKGQTEFCEGGQLELESSEAVSYKWFKNGTQIDIATDRFYQASTTGAYTVELTDLNNCVNTSPAMEVTVNPLPEPIITAKGQTEFCEGGQLELESSEAVSYKWFKNGTQIDIATDRFYQA